MARQSTAGRQLFEPEAQAFYESRTAAEFKRFRHAVPELGRRMQYRRLSLEEREQLRDPNCPTCHGVGQLLDGVPILCTTCQLGRPLSAAIPAAMQRSIDICSASIVHNHNTGLKARNGIIMKSAPSL